MTRAKVLAPIAPTSCRLAEDDGADGQALPLVVTHDPQVEQLLRQWEAERKTAAPPQPTPRPTPRREPYAYD
jgi:hypothetical protein